jgi:SulP family sulfate permease
VFAGLLLMGIVVFVAPLLAYLPNAAMAGILFLVAFGIIDFAHIRTIVRASRSDSLVLWGTFLATLFLQLDFAIMLGVFLSLAIYLHRASRPRVRVRVPDPRLPRQRFSTDPSLPECPQFKLVRIDGPVFFGAVNYVAERLRIIAKHNAGQKHLLIMSRTISFIDVAGAEMLAREARLRREAGGQLYFHQLQESAHELLERGGYSIAVSACAAISASSTSAARCRRWRSRTRRSWRSRCPGEVTAPTCLSGPEAGVTRRRRPPDPRQPSSGRTWSRAT